MIIEESESGKTMESIIHLPSQVRMFLITKMFTQYPIGQQFTIMRIKPVYWSTCFLLVSVCVSKGQLC